MKSKWHLASMSVKSNLDLLGKLYSFTRGFSSRSQRLRALLFSMRYIFVPWDLEGFMSLPTSTGTTRVSRVGFFHVTDPRDVIQKRLSRGIPWEPHLLLTERFLSFLVSSSRKYEVIDVGANIGTFTLHAAISADRVLAAEPNREALSLLKKNLELNPWIKNVTILPNLIGDIDGRPANVVRELKNNLGAFQLEFSQGEAGQYHAVSLDSVFTRESNDFVLIKIDVEGMESAVIDGGKVILGRKDCALLVEVWGAGQDDFREKMRLLGYRGIQIRRGDFLFVSS